MCGVCVVISVWVGVLVCAMCLYVGVGMCVWLGVLMCAVFLHVGICMCLGW